MSVAENIKYLRKQKHMTQKQLSEKTGLAVITIQQYEAGKYSPKQSNLIKLATALECEVSDIDESIIVHRHTFRLEPTSEDIEQYKKNAEAERLIQKKASGKNITEDEQKKIDDYIKRRKEAIPRFFESIKNFSNVVNKWGESILVTKYRELNNSGKREAIKRIDELTEIPRYTEPDGPDTPQD